ncbi:hypothetical protein [Amycolatopsis balhimycina]|uniref:hypothetical protein n=1 Tax=Amycolatopsis balhimycina TaxID=208443 RepID=UPI000F769487|nr:hypothetical protein [Amycolatopsis balhimycina]
MTGGANGQISVVCFADLDDSVQVWVDLIPLTSARIRYLVRRETPHSGGTGVGPFGVAADVATEPLGEFLFAVQVLIRCVSESPAGRLEFDDNVVRWGR